MFDYFIHTSCLIELLHKLRMNGYRSWEFFKSLNNSPICEQNKLNSGVFLYGIYRFGSFLTQNNLEQNSLIFSMYFNNEYSFPAFKLSNGVIMGGEE